MNLGLQISSLAPCNWLESFYVCPERITYLLSSQSWDFWKPNPNLILQVVEFPALLLKSGHGWKKTRAWELKWKHMDGSWRSWKHWNPKFCESPLPVEATLSPSSENVDSALPEEPGMASSQVVAFQDTAGFSLDSLQAPLFVFRTIAKLKFQQAPNDEILSLTHEELHYVPEELHYFSNLYRHNSGEYVWECMLKVWDNDER